MKLGIHEAAVVLEPFVSVTRVSVLVVVAIGGSTIREKNHDLVNGLWVLRKVILKLTKLERMQYL